MYPKCPDGREDCRFSGGRAITTLMNSPIEYDRAGRPVSGGVNTVTQYVGCVRCGREWSAKNTELELAQGVEKKWSAVSSGKPSPQAK